MSLLKIWLIYALWGGVIYCAVFIWAVRARQFSDRDRARYIALKAVEPVRDEVSDSKPGRLDRYTPFAVVFAVVALITVVLYIGTRGH